MKIKLNLLKYIFGLISNNFPSGKLINFGNKSYVIGFVFSQLFAIIQNCKEEETEISKELYELLQYIIGSQFSADHMIDEANHIQVCDLYIAVRNNYYSKVGELLYGTNVQANNDRDSLNLTDA